MIGARGTVPYPPHADGATLRRFACSLRELADGLRQSSAALTAATPAMSGCWHGAASQAFDRHVGGRSRTVDGVATSIDRASAVVETYAASVAATGAAYTSAAVAEQAARAGLPWSATALATSLGAQQAALAEHHAAGASCASALLAVDAEIAASVLVGVDPAPFRSLVHGVDERWQDVIGVLDDPDATGDAVQAAVTEVDAAMSPTAALPTGRVGGSLWDEMFGDRVGTAASVTNDAVGTIASIADQVERTRPRLSTVVDPMTGERMVVGGDGAPRRVGSPVLDPVTGRPIDLPPVGSGPVDGGPFRSSIIDARTGRPFEVRADGRAPVPGQSTILDPRTGQPFPADSHGRVIPGPRVVPVRRAAPTDPPAGRGGTIDERLTRIASDVAGMEVRLDQPAAAVSPSAWRTAGRVLDGAGRVTNVIGGVVGVYDVYRGVRDDDGFRVADGAIAIGLAIAGGLALATPVGWALLAVGAAWSLGSYLSGDVPLTRRLWGYARTAARQTNDTLRRAASVAVTGPPAFVPAPNR